MKGLGVLLMTVVLYSCGVCAQTNIVWDSPRETSKTDSVLEDVDGGSTIYPLYAINTVGNTNIYSIKSQVPPTPAFTLDGTDLTLPADGVDAETDQTFVFIFTANDGKSQEADSVEFTVTVIDVDDNAPVFNPPNYSGTVDDGALAGTTVLTITASDDDVSSSPIQYTITGGNEPVTFNVDSYGIIKVSNSDNVDRATTPNYSLKINATSDGKDSLTTVDITVNGATSPPEFLLLPYSTSICRNAYKGTALDIFNFTVQNSDAEPIEANFANSNTADCYTEGQSKSYSGNRQETRGGKQCDHWTTFDSVHEYVIDDNFPERSIVGASNYCRAPDGDNNPPWCFYNGGLGWGYCNVAVCIDVANFKMVFDSTSKNVISLQQELDVQAGSYVLVVTAIEGMETAAATITLNIWQPPVFNTPTDSDNTKICENTGPDEDIIQLTATSSIYTVTFSVVVSDLFEVVDGMLKTKSTINPSQFDIEPPTSASREYSIKLKVVDSNGCDDEITFFIKIEDDNDNDPVFSQGTSLDIEVEAGTSPGEVLTKISATDADVDAPNNVLTYTLTGDGVEDFHFDSERFELSVAAELSYTKRAQYELTLTATDGGTPTRSAMISVNINIITRPVFVDVPENGIYEMTEALSPGDTVTVLTTSDLDAVARLETITVSIVTDNSNLFTIDNTNPVSLKLKDNVDVSQYDFDETNSGTLSFPLTISVDDGNTDTTTDTTDIAIMVTDVNDIAPAFTQATYKAVIVDTISATSLVTTVTAVDGDVTQSFKNVMYSLSEDSTFEINSEGSIHVSSPSTVEYSSAGYTLTVTATDGLNHAVPAKVTITVQSGPVFVNVPVGGVYEMTEDKMPGATVTVLNTSDLDAVSRTETLTVIVEDNSNLFTIDNTDTPVSLKLKDDADMSQYNVDETDSGTLLFPLTISVDDGNTNTAIDTIDITVKVTDVNDIAPAFTQDTYEAVIVDTISATSLVTTVTAVDGDVTTSFNTVEYSLSGDSPFEIQSDGSIRVKTPSTVMYSSVGYTLTVLATDGLNSPVSVAVSITVHSAPVITNIVTAITIPEDNGRDMEVFDLDATDKDTPASGLQFSIVSITPDNALFHVDGSKIKTSKTLDLDAEVKTSEVETSYSLIFRVSDGTYSSDSQPFTFTVTDVNDNSPEFVMTEFQASINENKVLGTAVIQTEATDADVSATFNTIAYQITDGNEAGVFTIVESNGSIILETIPKLSMYTLIIKASDVDDSTKTATVQVKILVDASTVDECAVGPCKNGATCVPALNIYGCHCVDGWTGRECQTNIDDCILNPCSNEGLCSDLVDSFTCNCSEAWTGDTCTLECTGSTYGRNCEKLCGCVTSNLEDNTSDQFCNRTNGACNCNSKWQGHTCNEDVDECLSTTICDNKTNQACENYDGYYECVCQQGFSDNDQNICTKVPSVIVTATNPITEEVVNITMELTATNCPNLTVPSVYNKTKHELLQRLKLTLEDANDIIITNIRCGSIKFDMSVIVNKTQLPQLAVELQEIRDGKEFTLGDEVVTASRIDISGSELPATANIEAKSVCEVYTLLNPCTGLNRCDVTSSGQPFCRIVKDNNLDIILGVGLGVGIPLLLIAIICVVVCYCLLRKRQLQEKERKSSADEFNANGDYAAYSPPYQLPRLNGSSFKQGSSVTIYNGREQYQLAARNSLGYRNTHY